MSSSTCGECVKVDFYQTTDHQQQVRCAVDFAARCWREHDTVSVIVAAPQLLVIDEALWGQEVDSFLPHQIGTHPRTIQLLDKDSISHLRLQDVVINLSGMCIASHGCSIVMELFTPAQVERSRANYRQYQKAGYRMSYHCLVSQ